MSIKTFKPSFSQSILGKIAISQKTYFSENEIASVMKIPYILASTYVIAVGSVMATYNGSSVDKAYFQVKFLSWSKKFNKSYGTSEERNHRMQIWLDNHGM